MVKVRFWLIGRRLKYLEKQRSEKPTKQKATGNFPVVWSILRHASALLKERLET